jgi:hypothetical protein
MSLTSFYDRLREEIRRGDSLDSVFPGKTKDALRWLEHNYDFAYMRRAGSGTLPPGPTATPADLGWPPQLKAPLSLHFVVASNRYPCYASARRDWSQVMTGIPSRYFRTPGTLHWNALVAEPLPFETEWTEYSVFPADPTEDIWWTLNAEDVLLYQTVATIAGTVMRDPQLKAQYDALRMEALRTVLLAEERAEQGNNDLRFGVEFGAYEP